MFPIQLVLKSLLLLCSFYNQPYRTYDGTTHSSNTLETSPFVQVPVKVEASATCSEGPQFFQIFLKLAHEPTKPTKIRNGGNLIDLQLSISSLFPTLSPNDYFLSCGGNIITSSLIITFNTHVYRTIEIHPRLRGGMMKTEATTPDSEESRILNTLAAMMEQFNTLTNRLNESNDAMKKVSERLEILEEKKEIDDVISDSDEGLHTPTRTNKPRVGLSEVERTPYLKRSYSTHTPKEVKDC